MRILWTYVPEMPAEKTRKPLPWLTVVRWEYDGSGNEGMPGQEAYQHMRMLEATLQKIESPDFCFEAYRRIGDGLREFVFYIADREKFMQEFNRHAADDPRYPISIAFYNDATWSDLHNLIEEFKAAERQSTT